MISYAVYHVKTRRCAHEVSMSVCLCVRVCVSLSVCPCSTKPIKVLTLLAYAQNTEGYGFIELTDTNSKTKAFVRCAGRGDSGDAAAEIISCFFVDSESLPLGCGCSGGEGTPPETLKCLTPNPCSWHRPGLNLGPSHTQSNTLTTTL